MKKIISVILTLSVFLSILCSEGIITSAKTIELKKEYSFSGNYSEGQAIVLVKSNDKSILNTKNFFGKRIKINKILSFGKNGSLYNLVAFISSTDYTTKELIKAVGEKKCVYTAEPNYKRKISSLASSDYQWAIENNGQNGGIEGLDLQPEAVWNSDTDKSEKVIAIVDTGIDFENKDLKNSLWTNENTRDLPGLHGYDFVNNDTNPQDDNGHGTHCAGIIAGSAEKGKGISGIDNSAKIMALKVLDEEGYGDDESIMNAYNYIYEAQSLGINVVAVNNSWGSTVDSQIYKTIFNEIGKKGALQICAAGNESVDNDIIPSNPANTDSPYCISVAASNEKDELASFSNYGLESVDVVAPGTNILSTVSYDCYNPTIYSPEKQAQVSEYYNNFDSNTGEISIDKGNSSGIVSVDKSNEEFFGKKTALGNSSAKISLKNTKVGDIYLIKIPYTATSSANKNAVYDSLMIKADAPAYENDKTPSYLLLADTENSSVAIENAYKNTNYGMYLYDNINYWEHISFQPETNSKAGQERVILLAVIITDNYDDDYNIYIDDVGVSKPNTDTSVYGKYDFYSGTSMATPYVTGAIGLLSSLHKDLSPIQLKALIISSTRKNSSIEGKTVSGGVVDLSKALTTDNIAPLIAYYSSQNGKINIEGEYFNSNLTAKINGENATIISKTDKRIELDASKYLNTKVRVLIENEKGSASFTVIARPKTLNFTNKSLSEGEGGELISDGTDLYLIDTENCSVSLKGSPTSGDFEDFFEDEYSLNNVSMIQSLFSPKEETYENFDIIGSASIADLYPEYKNSDIMSGSLVFEGKPCYLNGRIWFISNFMSTGNHYKIVSFNTKTLRWKVEGKLPDDSVAVKYNNSILTAYNGKIYLLGGYSFSYAENGQTDKAVSKMVRVFNEATDKWTVLEDMPEARFKADARQIGNKLVVSFGSDGSVYDSEQDTYNIPKTMIFDGKNWTISKAEQLKAYDFEQYYLLESDSPTDFYEESLFSSEFTYFSIMPVFEASGGISADSIIYSGVDVKSHGQLVTYNPSTDKNGRLDYSAENDNEMSVIGTSVSDKYYIYYFNNNYFDDEDYDNYDYDFDYDYGADAENILYSFPIKSGCITITDTSKSGGKVLNCGRYLPGQTVTLIASPDKTHKFASLNVNGVKHSAKSVTVLTNRNISVKAKFKDIAINSIKLNFKKKVLAVGKKAKIKVKYKPTNATVKKVTYKSSNKRVVKVNKNGIITAKKAGKAVITVKTKNGKKAKCRIIVK